MVKLLDGFAECMRCHQVAPMPNLAWKVVLDPFNEENSGYLCPSCYHKTEKENE